MSEPIRFFEDLDPAARQRLLRRLEKAGPDGLVPVENLLIRQHLRPGLRRLRPERQRQPARVLLLPAEPFLVDAPASGRLPLIPRAVLAPLIRRFAGAGLRLDGGRPLDWSQPLSAAEEPAARRVLAAHVARERDALGAVAAAGLGGDMAGARRAVTALSTCLRHADRIAGWCADVPAGPILWIDDPLADLLAAQFTLAERAETGLGTLLLLLVARRMQDPSLLPKAFAAQVRASAALVAASGTVVGEIAPVLAADALAFLDRPTAPEALAGIDFFRVRHLLTCAELSGSRAAVAARLEHLLGRTATGALQAELAALLESGTPSVAAGEIERSLRELAALSRLDGLDSLSGALARIEADLIARLERTAAAGGRDMVYHLHLLELAAGSDRADEVRRRLRPRSPPAV
ncbi:hypothetical protein [Rhodocista pekingensis]|uniref:Uncharacterized protein n=1 Tax=Rhodocista pekingensis TaxID=201185 RepID=A0ABW2L223_9PROT